MHMSTRQRGQVLVTGASTGIGQATALHLHSLGFSVLAGVRRDEDAVLLRDCGLTPIHLDVARPEELTAARAEMGDRPLAGLVNNAGITRCGPLEFVPIADLREQFEVNVIGQVAVIQAFIERSEPAEVGSSNRLDLGPTGSPDRRPVRRSEVCTERDKRCSKAGTDDGGYRGHHDRARQRKDTIKG